MISVNVTGSFAHIEKFLKSWGPGAKTASIMTLLNSYGVKGINALREFTPKESGITSDSWSYEITKTNDGYSIEWNNSSINDGVPIALILQYGHGTGTGGYVAGIDYINPAIESIFQGFLTELEGVLTRV